MVKIEITYGGELRCQAVHGPSQEVLVTDAPVDNHGKGENFSPTDLVATALGTCMATIMGIVAARKDIDLGGLCISVEKEMIAEPVRRIGALKVCIEMPLPEEHPDRKLFENAAMQCPVHQSLHPDIAVPISWHWQ